MEYRDELQIAKKAEKMLTSALQSTVKKTFKEHFYNSEEKMQRMKDAVAKSVVKKYKYRLEGMSDEDREKYYLRSIKVRMARVGFVHHYGVDTTRAGHWRTTSKFSYHVEPHKYKLEAKPWITEALDISRIRDFIASEIPEIRQEEITMYIKKSLDKEF